MTTKNQPEIQTNGKLEIKCAKQHNTNSLQLEDDIRGINDQNKIYVKTIINI
mgnify:CR=1 FL=1